MKTTAMTKMMQTKNEKWTMEERWCQGLRKVWDYIGSDVLVNENGKPNYSMSLPRSHVFEICCDYMEMYSGLTKEDYKAFWNRDLKKDRTLIPKAFPFKRYGW